MPRLERERRAQLGRRLVDAIDARVDRARASSARRPTSACATATIGEVPRGALEDRRFRRARCRARTGRSVDSGSSAIGLSQRRDRARVLLRADARDPEVELRDAESSDRWPSPSRAAGSPSETRRLRRRRPRSCSALAIGNPILGIHAGAIRSAAAADVAERASRFASPRHRPDEQRRLGEAARQSRTIGAELRRGRAPWRAR